MVFYGHFSDSEQCVSTHSGQQIDLHFSSPHPNKQHNPPTNLSTMQETSILSYENSEATCKQFSWHLNGKKQQRKNKQHTGVTTLYYSCGQKHKTQCPATKTVKGDQLIFRGEHNHKPGRPPLSEAARERAAQLFSQGCSLALYSKKPSLSGSSPSFRYSSCYARRVSRGLPSALADLSICLRDCQL
jgi:hypothetical protein